MKLNANVYIGDERINVTDFVISLNRNWSLCNCLQTVTIILDPVLKNIMDIDIGVPLKPSLTVEVEEFGTKVFTGFISSVKYSRKPEPLIEILAVDKFKYAKDYFIDEDFGTTVGGETVASVAGSLLELCGLNYSVDSVEAFTATVPSGISLNLRTVEDALQELLAYSSSYIYTSPGGTTHITNGARQSTIKFKTGITTVLDEVDPSIIEGGNVEKVSHQINDTNTRDVVKVWGWKGQSSFLGTNESPYIQSEATVNLNLPVHKTILYSSSLIQDQVTADSLANRIIDEVGKFDSIKTVDCIGNPKIEVGQRVEISLDLESEQLTGTAKVTSIASSLSQDGYIMNVKMDEFCPRFAAWSLSTPSIKLYASSLTYGVFRSLDLGLNWSEYNTGLPLSTKNATRIAFDESDNGMAIVNNSLYRVGPESVWSRVSLPYPIDHSDESTYSGYGKLMAVDVAGMDGSFDVLASTTGNQTLINPSGICLNRSWVYRTTTSGNSWDIIQIHDNEDYGFYGTDLNSKNGTPYVAATKNVSDVNGLLVTKFPPQRTCYYASEFDNKTYYFIGTVQYPRYDIIDEDVWGIYDWDVLNVQQTGTYPNRKLTFHIIGYDYLVEPNPLSEPTTKKSNNLRMMLQSGNVMIMQTEPLQPFVGYLDANHPVVDNILTAYTTDLRPNIYYGAKMQYQPFTYYRKYFSALTVLEAYAGPSFWINFSFISDRKIGIPFLSNSWVITTGEGGPKYPRIRWDDNTHNAFNTWRDPKEPLSQDIPTWKSPVYPMWLSAGILRYDFQ